MNSTMLQGFHWYTNGNATYYDELTQMAPWLSNLGITSIWLPPAYKSAGGGYSVGYDPYDLFDLGEFDQKGTIPTKYGTKEQLLNATKALQENGIRIIVDIVINHKAGGDEIEEFHAVKVDPSDRQKNISEPFKIRSYTKFTFPGRGDTYSDFKWNFTCFSGVDFAEDQDGIFQIIHDYGDGWEEVIGYEKGNYDFLMYNDIEHRNPYVREELNYWGKWYHDQIFFDGVRLDAVKHQSPRFYQEWLHTLRANTGKNLFAVGEYWAPGHLPLLLDYIDATKGSMHLFDASLQHNFHVASQSGNTYDLRVIFDQTLVQARPDKAVTLVDNHDTQPLQELEAPVEPWFKPIAYGLILLRESGFPCVFLPDLTGATYKDQGNDGGKYEIFLSKVDKIEELLEARKRFAYGTERNYFREANLIGWTREGDGEHPGCGVLISNGEGGTIPMEIGQAYKGQTFYDFLGNTEGEIQIDENGWAEFIAPAGSISVWVPRE